MGSIRNSDGDLMYGALVAICISGGMIFLILIASLMKQNDVANTDQYINKCKYDTTIYDYYKDKHHRAKGGDWIEYTRVTYDKFTCSGKPVYLRTVANIEASEYRHSTLDVGANWKIVDADFSRSESILSAQIKKSSDSIQGSTRKDTNRVKIMTNILGKEPRMF